MRIYECPSEGRRDAQTISGVGVMFSKTFAGGCSGWSMGLRV